MLRHECLRQLFALYQQLCDLVEHWKKPTQAWVVIDAVDSSQDALYLHSENPNGDNFPYEFDRVDWGGLPPTWLKEFLSHEKHEFGTCFFNGNLTYWVREKLTE